MCVCVRLCVFLFQKNYNIKINIYTFRHEIEIVVAFNGVYLLLPLHDMPCSICFALDI